MMNLILCLSALSLGALALAAAVATHLRMTRRLAAERSAFEALRQSIDQRVDELERSTRGQEAIAVVLGNLLVEKGLFDEEELEDAHRRLVVEPALADQENDLQLAELPDRDSVRERMVRNWSTTVQ